ncbi:MAG: VCBS repeat-containing protein [Myxococcales bacterium]|nr:VCBS repeat-containing protein [Myxococcales bacterium]
MWWWLAACGVLPGDERSTWVTLCDGCFSTTTTSTTSPIGTTQLVEIDGDDVAVLATWYGDWRHPMGEVLVSIDDLDGDGLRDAWVSGTGEVLRTSDLGEAVHAWMTPRPLPVGDLDGDGAVDLALVGERSVVPGAELRAGGTFEEGSWAWSGEPAAVYGAPDLDGDGLGETAWLGPDPDVADGFLLHLHPGAAATDGFAPEESLQTLHIAEGRGGAFDLGDLDGDGVGELGLADGELLHVWSGAALAAGAIEELALISAQGDASGTSFDVARLGDVDDDGTPDLAIAVLGGPYGPVVVLSGAGLDGTVELAELTWLTGGALAIDAADLDGDAKSELLVTTTRHEVYLGSELGGVGVGPAWSWSDGASASLAGVGADGVLLAWVGEPLAFGR